MRLKKISQILGIVILGAGINSNAFANNWCEQVIEPVEDLPKFKLVESDNWDVGPDGKKTFNAQRAVRQQKQNANIMANSFQVGGIYGVVHMLGVSNARGSINRETQAAELNVDLTQAISYRCGPDVKNSIPANVSGAYLVFVEGDSGKKYVYSTTSLTAISFQDLMSHIEQNPDNPSVLEGTGWDFTEITTDGTEVSIGDGTVKIKNECLTDDKGEEKCLAEVTYKQQDVTSDGLSDRAYEALATNPTFQRLKETMTSDEMKQGTARQKKFLEFSGNCLLTTGEQLNKGADETGQININCNKVKLDENGNPVLDDAGNPVVEEYTKSLAADSSMQCETHQECVEEDTVEKTYDKGCVAPYDMETYIVDKDVPAGNCATKQKKGLYRCEAKRIVDTKNCEVQRNQSLKECVINSRYDAAVEFIPGYVPQGQQYRILYSQPPSFPLSSSIVTSRVSLSHASASSDGNPARMMYTIAEVVPDEWAYRNNLILIRVGSRGQRSSTFETVRQVYIDPEKTEIGNGIDPRFPDKKVFGAGDKNSTELQLIDLGDGFKYSVQEADYKGDLDGGYDKKNFTAYAHWALRMKGCEKLPEQNLNNITAEMVQSANGEINFYKYRCNIDFVGNYTTATNDEFYYNANTSDWAEWTCPSGMMHAIETSEYQCTTALNKSSDSGNLDISIDPGVTTGLGSPRRFQKAKCYTNVHNVNGVKYYYDDWKERSSCGSSYTFKQGTLSNTEPYMTGRFPIEKVLMSSDDALSNPDPVKGYTPYPKLLISLVNDQNSCRSFKDKDPQFPK